MLTKSRFKFNNETEVFSGKNANLLAAVSQAEYITDGVEATRAFEAMGFEEVKFFDVQNTHAVIAADKDTIVLAFRGTENLADAMTDLDIDLVAGAGGKVHEGFSIALNFVWREIWNYIKTQRKGRTLWVTGHSLGAALATLAVAKLRLEKDEPVNGLYTFGQPRTGDREFAKNFNADFGEKTFRFVNNNDIVARVPFRSMHYSHVGTFKYFDEGGGFHHHMAWWKRLLDRVNGRLQDILERGTDGVKDHSIDEYVNRCLNNFRV